MKGKKTLWGALLLLFITGCGVPSGQLRIRGVYEHLDQATFLIYSTDGGSDYIDTLHIVHGEFEYMTDLRGDASFHILYPNNDELMIWAHSGDDVTIGGSAQDLQNVRVGGNEENELYTKFRQGLEKNDTATLRRASAAFIRQNPTSRVSLYLLERWFLHCDSLVPSDSIQRLYQVLHKAQPRNNEAALMGGKIQHRYALQKGKSLPDFSLLTEESVRHALSDYQGHTLLLYFWAGWISSSLGSHRMIADSLRADTTLRAISYSLDIDSLTFRISKGDSTLNIPTYCDFQGFQGTLVKQMGITELPMAVLADSLGRIICTGREVGKVLAQRPKKKETEQEKKNSAEKPKRKE